MELGKIRDIWLQLSDKIRFLIIGGINTFLSYLLFVLFLKILGHSYYQVCVILQWSLSSVVSYLNQKFFVFCTKGNYLEEYIKCCSTWIISYFVNIIVLSFFVNYVTKNLYVSQFVSLFIACVVTYVILKSFAFRSKQVATEEV